MPARDYIQRLANQRFEGEVRNRLLEALENIAADIDEDALVEAIEAQDAQRALQAAGFSAASAEALAAGAATSQLPDATERHFDDMEQAQHAAAAAGGRETAKTIPPLKEPDGAVVRFEFEPGNERAAQRVNQLHTEQIREIGEETRGVIRDELQEGQRRGENPRNTARRIRRSIGLTRHQAQHVRNAEDQLRSADPAELRKYLGRTLRDRRFDRSILKAIREERGLDEETINKAVGRYRERYVQHRAETIARDQSLEALSQGQDEALDQAVDQGVVRTDEILREWVTARDARVREAHTRVPAMNRGGVQRGDMFQTPLGPLQRPRDRGSPGSVAANVINCRCALAPKIKRNRNVPQG